MILSGQEVAHKEKEWIAKKAEQRRTLGQPPCLAILRVGGNPSDIAYEDRIRQNGKELGIDVRTMEFPTGISEEELIHEVQKINEDRNVHGILIFRPLPTHIDEQEVGSAIAPDKDVDCMNPVQLQKLMTGEAAAVAPCTPEAVITVLKDYGIEIAGKNVVIVNRSLVLGKPLALLFLQENATVTVCHSKTKELTSVLRRADIVVTGIGKGKFFGPEYFNQDAVVIDVGINFIEGKMCGDVDFEAVKDRVAAITPVPGGIGAVTSTVLLKHV